MHHVATTVVEFYDVGLLTIDVIFIFTGSASAYGKKNSIKLALLHQITGSVKLLKCLIQLKELFYRSESDAAFSYLRLKHLSFSISILYYRGVFYFSSSY